MPARSTAWSSRGATRTTTSFRAECSVRIGGLVVLVVVARDAQGEPELGPARRSIGGPDPTAHRLDQRPADVQTDARAGTQARGRFGAKEDLEQPLGELRLEARALVEHAHDHLLALEGGANGDRGRVAGGVLGRVA